MRVSFVYNVENLEIIKDVIKNYNPKVIPHITTQINHIRENNTARLRLTIDGDDTAVQNLVNLINEKLFT